MTIINLYKALKYLNYWRLINFNIPDENDQSTNNEKLSKIFIYSITGEFITEIEKSESIIDISNYRNGIYFIQIESHQSITALKFIKH